MRTVFVILMCLLMGGCHKTETPKEMTANFFGAVKAGDVSTAKAYLDKGVNVNSRETPDGVTALHYAVGDVSADYAYRRGKLAMVQMLLKSSADLAAVAGPDRKPAFYLADFTLYAMRLSRNPMTPAWNLEHNIKEATDQEIAEQEKIVEAVGVLVKQQTTQILEAQTSQVVDCTCPLHPESISHQADTCPKCGLTLVPLLSPRPGAGLETSLRKDAEQGVRAAQTRLGICYLQGKGVNQDRGEAVNWFRKAAEQGDDEAAWNLGLCYAKGEGVEKDQSEACKWLRQAVLHGHREAMKALKFMQQP